MKLSPNKILKLKAGQTVWISTILIDKSNGNFYTKTTKYLLTGVRTVEKGGWSKPMVNLGGWCLTAAADSSDQLSLFSTQRSADRFAKAVKNHCSSAYPAVKAAYFSWWSRLQLQKFQDEYHRNVDRDLRASVITYIGHARLVENENN